MGGFCWDGWQCVYCKNTTREDLIFRAVNLNMSYTKTGKRKGWSAYIEGLRLVCFCLKCRNRDNTHRRKIAPIQNIQQSQIELRRSWMEDKKTIGECLRNNWNSINNATPEERSLRINIQNNFSCNGKFDLEYYIEHLWNKEAEYAD